MELLRLATAGSVDDGKSTLIGRLLYDSKSIFEDQLEAVERTPGVVMLALAIDVIDNPGQVALAERDNAVPCLPRERAAAGVSVVHVVRSGALEFADPCGDLDGRRQRHRHVNVVFDPADRVDDAACCFKGAMDEVLVRDRFDARREKRHAVLGAPHEVQVDFPVHVAGHRSRLSREVARMFGCLKAGEREAR